MKIDIHVHTKKVKQGDAITRAVTPERFNEIIKDTDVKILAVTNHNHFDFEQYKALQESVDGICQVWPGVELDILENGNRAHLIVIVSPDKAKEFSVKVESILVGFTPDNFNIDLESTVHAFDKFSPIYIAHYHSKRPNMLDTDVEKLLSLVSNPKRFIKEASNSISAGIYISHGHNSIHGSDVQDWDNYHEHAKNLPDLRLQVDSFEQFCLLLDKDEATINTILKGKTPESLQLTPFGNPLEQVELNIYNDINIIFGSKGTGKSDILSAISKRYNEMGFSTNVYKSNTSTLESVHDLRGNHFETAVVKYGIDECVDEIEFIRKSTEKSITRISDYHQYFLVKETNKISQSIKIRDFITEDANTPKRGFDDVYSSLEKFANFKQEIIADTTLLAVVGNDLIVELNVVLDKISKKLRTESDSRFENYRTIELFNHLIRIFTLEIAKKTGQPEKPLTTGFYHYASNRINIERKIKKILKNISSKIHPDTYYVGHLGEKGDLFCQTNLMIQFGDFRDPVYNPVTNIATKNPQRNFSKKLVQISKNLYTNDLFAKIDELNKVEGAERISCLTDLLQFRKFFTLNSVEYTPSTGESSMVLLHNELSEDKPIYLIDEPEKSLGNDYISNVIVPILRQHAQRGKKVIVATHDANIAVRTLPYNSIYRGHDIDGYYTFVGNPFSNNLKCLTKDRDDLDWKLISMKTLEGGKDAFGERRKIYGKA